MEEVPVEFDYQLMRKHSMNVDLSPQQSEVVPIQGLQIDHLESIFGAVSLAFRQEHLAVGSLAYLLEDLKLA